MTQIVPTVTADNAHVYRQEIERVAEFADRIHIDLADGEFAPTRLINPIQAWWPEDHMADIHLMYRNPSEHIETLISMSPSLVILHAESDGDLSQLIKQFTEFGIKTGIALLEPSQPEDYEQLIQQVQHVLIFGGKLGYHGGEAQLSSLSKIEKIKAINASAEIAWDGGINADNIEQLMNAGVDIFNVGGFIQKSDNPQDAYDILVSKLKQ